MPSYNDSGAGTPGLLRGTASMNRILGMFKSNRSRAKMVGVRGEVLPNGAPPRMELAPRSVAHGRVRLPVFLSQACRQP